MIDTAGTGAMCPDVTASDLLLGLMLVPGCAPHSAP